MENESKNAWYLGPSLLPLHDIFVVSMRLNSMYKMFLSLKIKCDQNIKYG